VFDLHTLRGLALNDLPDHVGAMALGMSAGRRPRRSHRILVLQPRSCVGWSIGFDLNEWVRTAILAIKVAP